LITLGLSVNSTIVSLSYDDGREIHLFLMVQCMPSRLATIQISSSANTSDQSIVTTAMQCTNSCLT